MESEDIYKNLSDEELVQRIVRHHDSLLFGVLYDRYAKGVYNKCYGFCNSIDETNDLTQDVFLKLFIKLSTYKGTSKFSTWLYSFTYNFCVNYVQRDKHKKINDKSDSIDEANKELSIEVNDESLFQLKVYKLNKALDSIDAEDKAILLLKYQDDASVKELAILYNIGESAVKMRLKRAKARLVDTYNKLI